MKLLDAINGSLVSEYILRMLDSCDPQDTPQMSRLWCSSPPVGANLESQSIRVHGICSRHDMSHFAFSMENELSPLVLPGKEEVTVFNASKTDASALSSVSTPFRDLDDLVVGGCGLSDFLCPLASVWTIRHGLLFRFQDGIFSRVIDFEIQDDKMRGGHLFAAQAAAKDKSESRCNCAVRWLCVLVVIVCNCITIS